MLDVPEKPNWLAAGEARVAARIARGLPLNADIPCDPDGFPLPVLDTELPKE